VRELPPAFAARGVRRAADAFFTSPLWRDRPLWGIAVIPRLADGRAAILGKLHHAMVDGVATVELGMLLFDATADAPATPPRRSPTAQGSTSGSSSRVARACTSPWPSR